MVAEALELLAAAEVERLSETATRLGDRIGTPEEAAGGAPDPERRARVLVAAAHGILIEAIGSGRAERDRDELVARFRELFALLLAQ